MSDKISTISDVPTLETVPSVLSDERMHFKEAVVKTKIMLSEAQEGVLDELNPSEKDHPSKVRLEALTPEQLSDASFYEDLLRDELGYTSGSYVTEISGILKGLVTDAQEKGKIGKVNRVGILNSVEYAQQYYIENVATEKRKIIYTNKSFEFNSPLVKNPEVSISVYEICDQEKQAAIPYGTRNFKSFSESRGYLQNTRYYLANISHIENGKEVVLPVYYPEGLFENEEETHEKLMIAYKANYEMRRYLGVDDNEGVVCFYPRSILTREFAKSNTVCLAPNDSDYLYTARHEFYHSLQFQKNGWNRFRHIEEGGAVWYARISSYELEDQIHSPREKYLYYREPFVLETLRGVPSHSLPLLKGEFDFIAETKLGEKYSDSNRDYATYCFGLLLKHAMEGLDKNSFSTFCRYCSSNTENLWNPYTGQQFLKDGEVLGTQEDFMEELLIAVGISPRDLRERMYKLINQ